MVFWGHESVFSGIDGPAGMRLTCGTRTAGMNHRTKKDAKVNIYVSLCIHAHTQIICLYAFGIVFLLAVSLMDYSSFLFGNSLLRLAWWGCWLEFYYSVRSLSRYVLPIGKHYI